LTEKEEKEKKEKEKGAVFWRQKKKGEPWRYGRVQKGEKKKRGGSLSLAPGGAAEKKGGGGVKKGGGGLFVSPAWVRKRGGRRSITSLEREGKGCRSFLFPAPRPKKRKKKKGKGEILHGISDLQRGGGERRKK